MERTIFEAEHEMFREAYRAFLDKEMVPHAEDWDRDGIVSRDVWLTAGRAGFLAFGVPESYGGQGVEDFRYNLVILEEICRANVFAAGTGMTLHNDVTLPYFLHYTDDTQKQRWLPGIASGELITAVAMTEPGIGSDLASMATTAIRDGDTYVLNGSKTFITNGILSDLVIVAAKTDPSQKHRGISLLIVERDMPGFERGRNLDKIGMHSQDTAELFFTDVRVPTENRLGAEGEGFMHLVQNLPQERLSIAAAAIAHAQATLGWTIDYCKERAAFGQPIGSFQNSKFRLAEMHTELTIGQTFIDRCVIALNAGQLTAEEAAMAKWWTTELQKRVNDTCLQLHGGYGYMLEYPVARAFQDGRVSTIYGGTTEIMKEVVGRSLGF
ncbi:MAG TPA: acyl-CoA dehydrogenase family protein [Microthrixaceae bacterium]|nr:acyl-CoA dehydrogenase family protein [Microthrixaceae bacterium]